MPRTKKIKEEVVPEKIEKQFSLKLKLNGELITTSGDSITECINNLGKFFAIKTKGVFVLKWGGLKAEVVMLPPQVRRLLINKTAKLVFEKRMLSILK